MSIRRLCLSSAAILVAVSSPAFAAPTIIGSGVNVSFNTPQVQSSGATTQIRFDDGSVISFVGEANYTIIGDRQIRVEAGNITVLGRSLPLTIVTGSTTITVDGGAAFTLTQGGIRSHVFSGTAGVQTGSETRTYTAGQAWQVQGGSLSRIVAAGPQAVPAVVNLRANGIGAAALNGLPVVLGEALAALGASSDIVAAGRSFDAIQQGVFDVSTSALPRDLETLIAFQSALAAKLGGGTAFQGSSPAIIDIYLRYLVNGGRIAEFQTAYTTLITTYLELLSSGGRPSDFAGLGILDIQAYLTYLQSVDGFGRFGTTQQGLIAEYLAFLRNGGDPAIFVSSNVQLNADIIALYQSALGNFVAFVRGGGSPAAFDGANQDLIARYIRLLASAGQLDALFGTQADVLRAYAAFVVAGGAPNDFDRFDEFGLTETLIADYTTTLQTYLTFLFNGGSVAGFDVDPLALAQLITELEQSDALLAAFPERRAVLLEFAAFVRDGNAAGDFFGFFTAGLSDAAVAQYAASVSSLLSVYAMGGSFADFDGDLTNIIRIIQILEAAGQLDDEFASARTVLLQFVTFVTEGGSGADFDGFVALGFDAATVTNYVSTINSLLSFVFDGGDLGAFDGNVDQIITLIQALENSGQLQTALGSQRTILLNFVSFITDGRDFEAFRGFLALGLSDTVVASYSDAITVFLQFIIDGGEIADFTGDLSVLLSYINDLQSAGRLSGVFSGAPLDALLAYSAFIADGGAPEDFTGFDGLADTGGGGGGGENPDTGEGLAAGPDVSVLAGVDRDAIAGFAFRSPTGALIGNSRGASLVDLGERFGNNRLSARAFEIRSNERDADGLPSDTQYRLNDMELVAAGGSGNVLLTRHTGSGTSTIGGTFSQYDGSLSVDSVFVANPLQLLPTTGQVIYDLAETLGLQTVGDYTGELSLDMVLGLQFGAFPRLALNGVLSADTDYIFSTDPNNFDGLSALSFENSQSTISNTNTGVFARIISGDGAFCTDSSSGGCFASLRVFPTSDLTQIGGTFQTRSNIAEDSRAHAVVSFLARSGFNFETVIPEVSPSGTVTAAYGFDRGILLRASGGSSNRNVQASQLSPRATLAFDGQGLSEMFRGFSNVIKRNTGAVADLSGDETWQVGRWVGVIDEDIFSQNSGLAYAVIPLLVSIPANGRVDYTLLGASRPTYGTGVTAPGTFEGTAALVINTVSRFGIDATITMPDATYTFTSIGGTDSPSIDLFFRDEVLRGFGSNDNFTTTVDGNGAACQLGGDACVTSMQIGIGGEDGSLAGISYVLNDGSDSGTALSGTAVFGGTLVPDEVDAGPEGIEREDQHVVYASNTIGIDSRDPATVIYDETTGAPLAYTWQLNDFTRERERPQIGTAVQREAGSAGDVLGWARWTEGSSAGRYYDSGDIVLPANAGWHVLSGTPATNLPTSGTVSYDLIGNTNPTRRDGTVAPGTLDSAQAAVQFGTVSRVGVELGVSIGGESYSLGSIGGVDDLSQGFEVTADEAGRMVRFGGNGFNGTATASGGSLCSGSSAGCNASITGFLAGDGASHLGLAYTFGNVSFESQVDGTAAFARAGGGATAKADTSALTTVKQDVPLVTQTWARWNHGSSVLGDASKAGLDRGDIMDRIEATSDRIPSWITYDRR